ncbi:MAG: HDOD domain-containing protein [Fibrobacterales bacterium]
MKKIGLMLSSAQEKQLLHKALKQNDYRPEIIDVDDPPNHFGVMKHKPDILLVEIPEDPINYLSTIQLVHGVKTLSNIPIIAYGAHSDHAMLKRLTTIGVLKYFVRPLKLKVLLNVFQVVLAAKEKAQRKSSFTVEEQKDFDLSSLSDPKVLGGLKLNTMVEYTDSILAFPFSIAKIVELTGSDDSSADDLANAIRSDPAMCTNLVKAANSVTFASRSNVIDFKDAIVRIGFKETKKIALGLKVINLHGKVSKQADFDRESYWFHSICCALVAEKLAKQSGYDNPAYAFLAGLLHEYYILLLDEYFPDIFQKVIFKTQVKLNNINEAFKEIIGFLPSDFVVALAKSWGIPREVVSALKLHKQFLNIPEDVSSSEERQLITIIGLADLLTKTARIGNSCDEYVRPIPKELFIEMGLNAGIPSNFFDSILQQIDMFTTLLGLRRRSFPEQCFISNSMENIHVYIVQTKRNLFEPHLYFLAHSDIAHTLVQSPEELEEFLLTPEETPLLIFNQVQNDGPTPFHAYLKHIHNGFLPKLYFEETKGSLTCAEDSKNIKLTKSLDLRSIVRAFDSLLTDLLDITR